MMSIVQNRLLKHRGPICRAITTQISFVNIVNVYIGITVTINNEVLSVTHAVKDRFQTEESLLLF